MKLFTAVIALAFSTQAAQAIPAVCKKEAGYAQEIAEIKRDGYSGWSMIGRHVPEDHPDRAMIKYIVDTAETVDARLASKGLGKTTPNEFVKLIVDTCVASLKAKERADKAFALPD